MEWQTRKENKNHNDLQKRMKRKYEYSQLRIDKTKEKLSKKILRESIDGSTKIYNSISDAKKDGFNAGNISACCLGKRKSHKKYKWFFI